MNPWTKQEYEYLLDNYYGYSVAQLARALGRPGNQVITAVKLLREQGFLKQSKNAGSQNYDAIKEIKRERGGSKKKTFVCNKPDEYPPLRDYPRGGVRW